MRLIRSVIRENGCGKLRFASSRDNKTCLVKLYTCYMLKHGEPTRRLQASVGGNCGNNRRTGLNSFYAARFVNGRHVSVRRRPCNFFIRCIRRKNGSNKLINRAGIECRRRNVEAYGRNRLKNLDGTGACNSVGGLCGDGCRTASHSGNLSVIYGRHFRI